MMLDDLKPFAPTPDMAEALRERVTCFVQAMAAGGQRAEYEEWKASRDALIAALEVIGEPADRAGAAGESQQHNGAAQR